MPQTVEISPVTRFGENPFSTEESGPDRCPRGHVLGLNRLSELSVFGGSWQHADLAATAQFAGVRRGYLRPEPMLVMSRRFREVVELERLKGLTVEVARGVTE